MDMPTNSPEAQEKCPACGEPNYLDHAPRTAPPKAEAQPQGVELLPCPLIHPIKNGVKFTGFSKAPTNVRRSRVLSVQENGGITR
jgi:hypothetical protein